MFAPRTVAIEVDQLPHASDDGVPGVSLGVAEDRLQALCVVVNEACDSELLKQRSVVGKSQGLRQVRPKQPQSSKPRQPQPKQPRRLVKHDRSSHCNCSRSNDGRGNITKTIRGKRGLHGGVLGSRALALHAHVLTDQHHVAVHIYDIQGPEEAHHPMLDPLAPVLAVPSERKAVVRHVF